MPISKRTGKRYRLKIVPSLKKSVDSKQNKEIKKLKKEVKKLSKSEEKKWFDRDVPSTAVPLAGTIQPLLALNVWGGTDNTARQNEREGQSINVLSYKIKGQVYIDQDFASPDSNNKVRIMLVQMTDDNIIQPALTDILEDPTGDRAIYSYLKIKGQRRYKVHYDKTFNLQNPGQYFANASGANATSTATERFRKEFRINVKIPKSGMKASYAQGSISGNGPVQNGLFLVAYSDSGVISHPAIFYRSRMRFLDN